MSIALKKREASSARPPLTRKVSREQRQRQIILATMRVLARKGYANTMVSDVAAEAGISHGLVLFHFESKERLLAATLLHMSDEYRSNWTQALARSGPSPAEQLAALLSADFEPSICTPEHLACWLSFWSEVQGRPIYQQECAPNDMTYIAKLEGICARLIEEGGYKLNAVRTARVLRLTSEGLWHDMFSMTSAYSPAEALRTLHTCAAVHFPRHFNEDGLIRREDGAP